MIWLLLAFMFTFIGIAAFAKLMLYLFEWVSTVPIKRTDSFGYNVKPSKTYIKIKEKLRDMHRAFKLNRIKRLRRLKLEYEVSILELDKQIKEQSVPGRKRTHGKW